MSYYLVVIKEVSEQRGIAIIAQMAKKDEDVEKILLKHNIKFT
jgi:hypothetical protein